MADNEKSSTAPLPASVSGSTEASVVAPDQQTNSDTFKRSVSVCARAVAADRSLDVDFVDGDFKFDARSGKLADVPEAPTPDQIAVTRGHSDSIGLYRNLHDPDIHAKHQPKAWAAQMVFAMAEQIRCEAHGARRFAGVAKNLDASMNEHYKRVASANDITRETMPMEEAVALKLRESVMQRPIATTSSACTRTVERMAG